MLNESFSNDDESARPTELLEDRLKAMLAEIETEFQVLPTDILTRVVLVLADRDPWGLADVLENHAQILRMMHTMTLRSSPRNKRKRPYHQ